MNISGLNPSTLTQLPSLERSGSTTGAGKADSSFGSVVRDSLESMEQTQKAAEQEVARAVTGESPDLHRTIIALQTADLNFQLGLQVRNKVIGAYEDIMRMQV